MGQTLRLVTDSIADLPPELVRELSIEVVPIYFSFEDWAGPDDGRFDRTRIYQAMRNSSAVPTTAAPAPGEFLAAYQRLVAQGAQDIIGLFLASPLSSIATNAFLAAQQVQGAQVHVLESGQVSLGIGFQVLAAARAAAQGASVEEVKRLVADVARRTYVAGFLESIMFLQRGGRVGWALAWVGDFLQIKPLVSYHQGEATLLGKVRTYRRALTALVEWVRDQAPLEHLAFLHTDVAPEILQELEQGLSDLVPAGQKPWVVEVSPVFGAHVGPGAVGVALVRASGR